MTATVEKMNSLKAMAYYFRPDDADVAINSLNTAWTRAKLKGDLQLGDFSRGRTDLTAYEHDFAKSWFDNDKANPSVQTPFSAQIINPTRDEVAALKHEKTTLFNALNAEKSAKEAAEKTVADLTNKTELLRGQITSLNSQIERADKSAEKGLSAQTAILQRQIASLEDKLAKTEAKLDAATEGERKRADATKTAHETALDAVNVKLVEAMEAYKNQLQENDANWFNSLKEAEAKNAALVAAHAEELAPHLQSQAEREAKVTVLELINYGEIAVAVVGACIMFQWVGAVIAFPAVLFYYDAMRTVKKANSWDSAQFAILVCGILSLAFGFVHYNTALKYNDSDAYDKSVVACFAAVILSGISVAALWQNYLKKNENQ